MGNTRRRRSRSCGLGFLRCSFGLACGGFGEYCRSCAHDYFKQRGSAQNRTRVLVNGCCAFWRRLEGGTCCIWCGLYANMKACIYARTCVYAHLRMYVCTNTNGQVVVYVYVWVHAYVCLYSCLYIRISNCMCACAYIRTKAKRTSPYVHTSAHHTTRIHTSTHTHTHTYAFSLSLSHTLKHK